MLLSAWPRLRRQPVTRADVCSVAGFLEFVMEPPGLARLGDCYSIRIDVPLDATEHAPEAYETAGRIPHDAAHHVNPGGAMCLGSPWAVRRRLGKPPSLVRLVEQCVLPFLYAATWRAQGNSGYPFAELDQGGPGLLDDYESILDVKGAEAVTCALRALTHRRRVANKLPCACGCGQRLGVCDYRVKLNPLRAGSTRPFFRALLDQFAKEHPPRRRPSKPFKARRATHDGKPTDRLVLGKKKDHLNRAMCSAT